MSVDALISISVAFGYLATVLVAGALVTLVFDKQQKIIVEDISFKEDGTFQYICEQLAREYGLSGREFETLLLLAKGYTKPNIAQKLFISEGTVRTHVKRIYRKLGCNKKDDLYTLIEERRHPQSENER